MTASLSRLSEYRQPLRLSSGQLKLRAGVHRQAPRHNIEHSHT
jgi:hypothetical protein